MQRETEEAVVNWTIGEWQDISHLFPRVRLRGRPSRLVVRSVDLERKTITVAADPEPRRRVDWRYVGSYVFVVGLVLLQAVFFCWGTSW